MKRLLNQLLVTDSETERTEHADETSSSDSVEWSDISTNTNGPTGWASNIDPEERERSETKSSFETLAVDQLVETILDGVAVPTLVADQAGEIVYINSAACETFETDESDAVGVTPTAVHGGQHLLDAVLLAGEEITARQETVIADGSERTLCRTLTPLKDGHGEIVGAVETIREVSENGTPSE